MIKLTIPAVHGKGRPRFRSTGKFIQTYTDKKTASFENLVKLAFMNSGSEAYVNEEALILKLEIYQAIPTSISKKKKKEMLEGKIHPTKKPDVDNVIKSVLDGLNKVAYADDKQIIEIQARKKYGQEEKIEVEIYECERIE
jgi:Holliday junction resolvase